MMNHYETIRAWFVDSVHQHSDNVIVLAVSLLWAHGDEKTALIVAFGAMLFALFGLWTARKVANKVAVKREAHEPIGMQAALFEASFINILREHQVGQ